MRSNAPAPKRARTNDGRSDDENDIEMGSVRRASKALPRYLAFLEYDGAKFRGFQRQKLGERATTTVQDALDEALETFTGNRGAVASVGSSRTDVGVHATRNSAHFDCARVGKDGSMDAYDSESVRRGLNYHLKSRERAMRVTECVRVDTLNPTFHARHDAVSRRYRYEILVGDRDDGGSVFDRDGAWYLRAVVASDRGAKQTSSRRYTTCEATGLDVDAMRRAASVLIGKHDFSSFRASGCQAKSPIRTITSLDVVSRTTEWPSPEARGTRQEVSVRVEAPSFLYHQVRLLVGALKSVGAGDLTVDNVRELLEAKDVSQAPQMAPAHGLYLMDVGYLPNYASRTPFSKAKNTDTDDGEGDDDL